MSDIEVIAKLVCTGKYSSLSIRYNDFKSNYQTATEAIEENFNSWYDPDSFVSLEEMERCKQTNTIWEIQWYPDTPVGFYKVMASTLEAALAAVSPTPAQEGTER